MTPAFPWRATIALCAAMALTGSLYGWRVATLTETDVIEAAAARYVQDHGGRREDCIAVPGAPQVWITVLCGRPEALAIYQADRLGRLTETAPADPSDAISGI